MILRRLIDHFRKQEWTAIAIDFLIVVIGVFIGIQVANWNAARKDGIDAGKVLLRLHHDIETAEALSARLRTRRLATWRLLPGVTEIIFGRSDRSELTEEECYTIQAISYFNVANAGLPALTELIASGRVGILRDDELRDALGGLQQKIDNLADYIGVQNGRTRLVTREYPDIIKLESYQDEALNEVQSRADCDVAAMRKNQGFLNNYSINADMYDAYIRDAFLPWDEQLANTHRLLDNALRVTHQDRP